MGLQSPSKLQFQAECFLPTHNCLGHDIETEKRCRDVHIFVQSLLHIIKGWWNKLSINCLEEEEMLRVSYIYCTCLNNDKNALSLSQVTLWLLLLSLPSPGAPALVCRVVAKVRFLFTDGAHAMVNAVVFLFYFDSYHFFLLMTKKLLSQWNKYFWITSQSQPYHLHLRTRKQ